MTSLASGANGAPTATDTQHDSATAARRSWSQLSAFRRCAKAWQLEKVTRTPSRPGVWLPAGTAFHASAERYLRERHARGY